MTQVMGMPVIGNVLDRPVDPRVRRSFFTDTPNASHKITIQQQIIPDIVSKAKPRGVGDNLLEILQQAVQTQTVGSDPTKKAMPSNLSWRG
jgi:hypothetical protein